MNTTLRQSSSSWELEALGAGIDDPLDELSLAVVLVDHAGRIRWQNRTSLARLAAGRSTPEIADRLGFTLETARNYVRRLLRGLGAHSRLEAVAKGHRLGLIPRDPPGSSGR